MGVLHNSYTEAVAGPGDPESRLLVQKTENRWLEHGHVLSSPVFNLGDHRTESPAWPGCWLDSFAPQWLNSTRLQGGRELGLQGRAEPFHSARSVTIGSARVARQAGIVSTQTETLEERKRARATESAKPTRIPTKVSARRMPISRSLWPTL
mgnify:CR=1 FL=1